MIDLSHYIHELTFGVDVDPNGRRRNTLKDFHSEKEIK